MVWDRSAHPPDQQIPVPLVRESLADFWSASTLGLLDVSFEYYPQAGQDPLILNAPRNQQRDSGPEQTAFTAAQLYFDGLSPAIDINDADGLAFWVDPPTTDWGASGSCEVEGRGPRQKELMDQMQSMTNYAHELGHVLGWQHPFGVGAPDPTDPVYRDAYCVMGYSNLSNWRAAPEPAVDALAHGGDLWTMTRLASAANSYRCFAPFANSPSVRPIVVGDGQVHEITALSRAQFGDVVLLVIPHGESLFFAEYRTANGWDAGVTPAVVVHSLYYQAGVPTKTENRPVWFEGVINTPWEDSFSAPDGSFHIHVSDIDEENGRVKLRIDP